MKKSKKLLILALSAILALGACAFASCGEPGKTPGNDDPVVDNPGGDDVNPGGDVTPEPEPAIDFSAYTKAQFLAEDFASKKIDYQFTGSFVVEGYMSFEIVYNVYADGSVRADQRNIDSKTSYLYYGFWEDASDEDGKALTIDTMYMTGLEEDLIDYATDYTIYQEADGNFSFGFDICLAPGQYKRVADMKGGSTVVYATDDAFHQAVDKADAE